MTTTPWGPADELRSKRLRPGPGSKRDAVMRNQRGRLLGATVAVVAERGYENTRVADLVEVAGVSRGAFYRHFANKQDCFVATIETIVEAGAQEIMAIRRAHSGSWDESLAAGFDRLIEMIVEQPAAARLRFLEVQAAGPEAIAKVEQIDRELDEMALGAVEQSPERAGAPRALVTAIFGGFRKVIERRLRQGREQELKELAPQLLDWGLSYQTPAQPLKQPRRPPAGFKPSPPNRADPRERIMVAIAELLGETSYSALKVSDVAARASVSLSTFYANFGSKEEALLAALEYGIRLVLEAAVPPYKNAPDWPHAISDAMHASFGCLALEPIFADFTGVDIYKGAPRVRERRDDLIIAAEAFLAAGHREHPQTSPIAAEAIGGSIDTLLYEQTRLRGARQLYEVAPIAAFITLAPFIGSDRAAEVANEGWAPRRLAAAGARSVP